MSRGAYILFIDLRKDTSMDVGRLGSFTFRKGRYLYVGSALNNLEKRIARHRSKTKKLHWHIDYLLQSASIEEVLTVETDREIECLMNRIVSEICPVEAVVKGFGSSDCRCLTHLWKVRPEGKKTVAELATKTEEVVKKVNVAIEYSRTMASITGTIDSI